MLFHTWTFLVFMVVVLPVLFALRRTRLWIPWLLVASYTFYGWWNPYYLILVFYSTLLDFILVALMAHCPLPTRGSVPRTIPPAPSPDLPIFPSPHPPIPPPADPVMKVAFVVTAIGTAL